MMLLQDGAQFVGNALGKKDGNSRADSKEFDVFHFSKPAQQIVNFRITQKQRIAAAQKNVSNFGMLANVFQLPFQFGVKAVSGGIADHAGSSAVSAIRGASVGNQKENSVGITVDDAGNRRIAVFPARIGHFPIGGFGFVDFRNDLLPNGTTNVVRTDQIKKVWCDGHRQLSIGQLNATFFFGREIGDFSPPPAPTW